MNVHAGFHTHIVAIACDNLRPTEQPGPGIDLWRGVERRAYIPLRPRSHARTQIVETRSGAGSCESPTEPPAPVHPSSNHIHSLRNCPTLPVRVRVREGGQDQSKRAVRIRGRRSGAEEDAEEDWPEHATFRLEAGTGITLFSQRDECLRESRQAQCCGRPSVEVTCETSEDVPASRSSSFRTVREQVVGFRLS